MTSPSKRKGNAFENVMAKHLNRMFDTLEFCKTPSSGAWMGKTNAQKRAGLAQEAKDTLRGDIMTPRSFPYVIECKFNSTSPSYNQLISGYDAKLDSWIKEVEYDAAQSNKLPMLVFKNPRKDIYFVLPGDSIADPSAFAFYLKYDRYIIISLDTFEKHKHLFYVPVDL